MLTRDSSSSGSGPAVWFENGGRFPRFPETNFELGAASASAVVTPVTRRHVPDADASYLRVGLIEKRLREPIR